MNASRPHTDGEHHQGDTTVIQRGVVVVSRGQEEARAIAASIYVIQNKGRAPEDCDTLPEGITAEDVERAIIRHRREANRQAIERHKTALSTPLPKREPTPADQRVDRSEDFTGRVPMWVFVMLVLVIGLAVWGGIDLVDTIGKALRLW